MGYRSRGLLSGMDVSELKGRIRRKPFRPIWERMVSRWREVAGKEAEGDGSQHYGALGWWSVTPKVMEAGLIYRLSGEPEALAYVERHIRKLAEVYSKPGIPSAWRGEERPALSHGQLALAADMCRDALSAPALETLLGLAREHFIKFHDGDRHLYAYSVGANTPVCKALNAGIVALVWGEDCGYPDWAGVVNLARDASVQFIRRGVDANGYPYEGTGYGLETLYYVYLYAQLLYQNGRDNLFESQPTLRAIPEAALSVMFPDRSALANINDLGLGFPPSMPWLLLTAKYYDRPVDLGFWLEYQGPDHPQRPCGDLTPWYNRTFGNLARGFDHVPSDLLTLLWWNPKEKALPIEKTKLPTALCTEGTQMANFRTGWGRDAVYVNFLGSGRSHVAHGHAHADCGHFSIFAHGEYLAIDTGRYNVDEDQHNVVLVDGKCHMPMPEAQWGYNLRSGRLKSFLRHKMVDYVVADSAFLKDCMWADRHLLFVKLGGDECYVVMIDNVNKDHRKHSCWWQLHAHPEAAVIVEGERSASVRGRKARLDIDFVSPDPGDFPQEAHQLALRADEMCWAMGKDKPSAEALKTGLMVTCYKRPRLIAEQTGLNCVLMAVIVPRRNGQPRVAVRQVPAKRVLRAEIDWGGHTDIIISALDHGCIKFPDVEGFAELALIRRTKDGKVEDVWIPDGDLSVKE